MERKSYLLGLLKEALIIDKNVIIYNRHSADGDNLLVHFNRTDHGILIFRNNAIIPDESISKDVVMRISDDGSRWEGDCYNELPIGFGSVYDGEGNRIYSEFMFEGKKIGFGEEYFADNHKVDYCGNFMNDKRHGWGVSYDRNGNKLYESEWRCGKNDFEEKIVIEDNCEKDCLRIHDLIKELEIGENCFNEWIGDLVIDN